MQLCWICTEITGINIQIIRTSCCCLLFCVVNSRYQHSKEFLLHIGEVNLVLVSSSWYVYIMCKYFTCLWWATLVPSCPAVTGFDGLLWSSHLTSSQMFTMVLYGHITGLDGLLWSSHLTSSQVFIMVFFWSYLDLESKDLMVYSFRWSAMIITFDF